MKLYLDSCIIQRPLDDKRQLRVLLEAEAVLAILAVCESGGVELVSSDALLFEMERNPNPVRQEYARQVLSRAGQHVSFSDQLQWRARELNASGFRPFDALHLASAEEAGADYLCTCDDRFLRKANAVKGIKTKVVSPIQLIGELEHDSGSQTSG